MTQREFESSFQVLIRRRQLLCSNVSFQGGNIQKIPGEHGTNIVVLIGPRGRERTIVQKNPKSLRASGTLQSALLTLRNPALIVIQFKGI